MASEKQLLDYIKQFKLDEFFSSALISELKVERLPKGALLCALGEPLENFYMLVEGKLKIYALQENGKKILIRFYRPFAAVGDLEFLSDYEPNALVETQEPSTVLSISMATIRKSAYDCPKFLRFVVRELSRKMFAYSRACQMNLVYPLENRIASYLWSICTITDGKQLEEIRVTSLNEMADLLCTSYRHLSRVLTQLEDRNIISRNRGKIKIIDHNQLNNLAVGLFE